MGGQCSRTWATNTRSLAPLVAKRQSMAVHPSQGHPDLVPKPLVLLWRVLLESTSPSRQQDWSNELSMSLANWFSLLCPTPSRPSPAQPGPQQPDSPAGLFSLGCGGGSREWCGSGASREPPSSGLPSASLYLRWVEAHKIEKVLPEISLALPRRGWAQVRSRPDGDSGTPPPGQLSIPLRFSGT